METRTRNVFDFIHTEGALLPTNLLQRILAGDKSLPGLDADSYHLLPGENLREVVTSAWKRMNLAWDHFKAARRKLPPGDPGTTVTRERWLLPLFEALGYGRLRAGAGAIEIEGKSYPISHPLGNLPIHLVGCNVDLDKRSAGVAGAARSSPHSLVQELLNRHQDVLWGFVSNGLRLRILRDNASLTRQAYLEFDLEGMFEGQGYSDFLLLWLLCHASRCEADSPAEFWLEKWSQAAQEQGVRALDDLRKGVEEAIRILGSGFLAHPANTKLRLRLQSGELDRQEYYRQLLRLAYRLIFLFTAEDRDLLLHPDADPAAKQTYRDYYSTARLRRLARRQRGSRHGDLWQGLKVVTDLLGGKPPANSELQMANGEPLAARCSPLGLPVLGGFLFSPQAIPDLEDAQLENGALLEAVRRLAFTVENRTRRVVDYKNLGPEELGSVYESLLELHPRINTEAATFDLQVTAGSERKSTGSYYTPASLIQALLDSALEPVIEDALSRGRRLASGELRIVNGEWQIEGEALNDREANWVNTVLSGLGSVAAGDDVRRASVQSDQGIPSGGDVRVDESNAPGSRLDSSQPRRGVGTLDDEGISAFSEHRPGQPARAGDAPSLEPTDKSQHRNANQAAVGDHDDTGETDRDATTQFGEEGIIANGGGRMANGYVANGELSMANGEAQLAARYSRFTALPLAARYSLLAERSLLDLKVCDPACGSGHFLIAAAHRIANRLARLRSGEEEPAPLALRRALREVIAHCIYGVDLNPMAVELCKVNLWLESLEPGKPLSFLDAHIKRGNSLVGVGPGMNLNDLEVPDEAFNPVTGDHKPTAALLKKRNKQERAGQESLFVTVLKTKADLERWLAERARAVEAMPEETAAEVQAKAEAYRQVNESAEYRRRRQVADLWTAAFFWKIEEPQSAAYEIAAPTHGQLRRLRQGSALQPGLLEAVERLSQSQGFFHWSLEFPEVFMASSEQRMANGESPLAARQASIASAGFDCVLGNPPWERIKLQEEEFFAARDPEIAAAPNKAARERMIKQLRQTNPALAQDFEDAKHAAECNSKFVRKAQRYPLTAVGDVNTYALFAEHFRALMSARGRAGIILPTGIATDDTTKDFFGDLVEKRAIASLYDFENREAIFPGVHRSYKFCLLTLCGAPVERAQFVFFATRVEHLRDERRRFSLDPAEIALFNPNTRTMPVFRTRADAELTRAIYQRVPVLVNERTGENPWGVSFLRMFDMSNDSHLFVSEPRPGYVRLYEAKMFWHYDHRWGTFEGDEIREVSLEEKQNPRFFARPRYWVPAKEVDQRLGEYSYKWLIGFRDVTNITNERTAIFTIIPRTGAGHTAPIIHVNKSIRSLVCSICCFNSIALDYFIRQKVGGMHLTYNYLRQFPFLPPTTYSQTNIDFIVSRVLELVYTAYDLQPFAQDILDEIGAEQWNAWFPHNPLAARHSPPAPFPWDEARRALLRAELDAYYANLYGLTRKQLRYILDPADLTRRELEDILDPWEEVGDPLDPAGYAERCAQSDFPGETFRVLREKEIRQYGEYRTRRLVLEAWERLEANGEWRVANSKPFAIRHSPLTEDEPLAADKPPPADFGLYKCEACGKMVMGFDRESHIHEAHQGKKVEWKRVR